MSAKKSRKTQKYFYMKVFSVHKCIDDKRKSAKEPGNSIMFWDIIKPFMIDEVKSVNENISHKVCDSTTICRESILA